MSTLADRDAAAATTAHALALQVADILPGRWLVSAPDGYRGVYLEAPSADAVGADPDTAGARIFIALETYRGDRVEVSGSYPREAVVDLRPKRVEATVALARGARAVATAIRSRVLPTYVPELRRVEGVLAARRAREAGVADTVARLAPLAPAGTRTGGREGERLELPYVSGGVGGHLQVTSPAAVSLELDRVPVALAEHILALVTAYAAGATLAPTLSGVVPLADVTAR